MVKEFRNLTQVAMYIRHKETKAELMKGYTLHLYYDKKRKLFLIETTKFEAKSCPDFKLKTRQVGLTTEKTDVTEKIRFLRKHPKP